LPTPTGDAFAGSPATEGDAHHRIAVDARNLTNGWGMREDRWLLHASVGSRSSARDFQPKRCVIYPYDIKASGFGELTTCW
jgi:hypothetical protein